MPNAKVPQLKVNQSLNTLASGSLSIPGLSASQTLCKISFCFALIELYPISTLFPCLTRNKLFIDASIEWQPFLSIQILTHMRNNICVRMFIKMLLNRERDYKERKYLKSAINQKTRNIRCLCERELFVMGQRREEETYTFHLVTFKF